METIISPLVSEYRKKYRVKQINEMCQDMDAYKLKYFLEDLVILINIITITVLIIRDQYLEVKRHAWNIY